MTPLDPPLLQYICSAIIVYNLTDLANFYIYIYYRDEEEGKDLQQTDKDWTAF